MKNIKIGNNKYPVRFISGGRFKQLAGHDVNQMQEEITEQIILLYAFTSATCRADGSGNCENEDGQALSIDELLAYATGCMKMSRQDFEACTPFEFSQMVKELTASELKERYKAAAKAAGLN